MNPPAALILSHEPIVSLGLKTFLLSEGQFQSCQLVDSPSAALRLLEQHAVALVVVVACSAHGEIPRAVRDITKCRGKHKVLIFARPEDHDLYQRVVDAGAHGVVTVADDLAAVKLAVSSALEGSFHLSHTATKTGKIRLSKRSAEPNAGKLSLAALSDREAEVFGLVGQELPPKELAHQLGISPKTVETHLKRIKEKLHISNMGELRRAAQRNSAV